MNQSVVKLSASSQSLLNEGHICCAHTHLAVLKASGEGLHDYLQGQITQDVKPLSADRGLYACALTPQGKPVADMHIMQGFGDELVMFAEASHAEALVGRLRHYALGYQVRIGIVAEMAAIAVQGLKTDAALLHAGLPVPGRQTCATARAEGTEIFCMRMTEAASDGVWVVLPKSDVKDCLEKLGNTVGESEMEAARILAGSPRFGIDWDESTYPLNANLIERRGVSFDKGCYIGQEVTSRMRWRGRIRKKLYRVSLSDRPNALPCNICTEATIGVLTSATANARGEVSGIALLNITTVEAGQELTTENDVAIKVLGACGLIDSSRQGDKETK